MAIPESQLEIWAHQGSITQSSTTYATVKRALEASDAKYAGKDFEVFLQGSYGNDTNIYAESDIDIVIRLDSTYHYDVSDLTATERAAFNATLTGTAYSYDNFKDHVLNALKKSFGQAVKPGVKAIKVDAYGSRRSTDVVVATEFRDYRKFSTVEEDYEAGICFFTSTGERIANYPRQHFTNCTSKHQATNSWFKPMVRILKNLRSKLVDDGLINQAIAPSYFLEGLLYNVPYDKFGGSYEDTMVGSINWILNADRSKFVCANERYYLLGNSSITWPAANCDYFLAALKKLWTDW